MPESRLSQQPERRLPSDVTTSTITIEERHPSSAETKGTTESHDQDATLGRSRTIELTPLDELNQSFCSDDPTSTTWSTPWYGGTSKLYFLAIDGDTNL